MPPRRTKKAPLIDERLEELLTLIKDADSVELKLHVAAADQDKLDLEIFRAVKIFLLSGIERQIEQGLRSHADFERLGGSKMAE
jgi:hypothetical protein